MITNFLVLRLLPLYSLDRPCSVQHFRLHPAAAKAVGQIGAWLLPQDCLLCGSPSGASILCRACSDSLPRLPPALCPVCALPSPAGQTCGACLREPPHFDATVAGFRYDFPIDRLVQALKYDHRLALATWFAQALLHEPPRDAELMLALPLSRRRLSERGFNQALEIARPLARSLGLPLATEACSRVRESVPQARLPWQARQGNVRGIFDCSLDLAGRSVIVVDDVMTTGASLNEFARILKKHRARYVTNWVVARALRH